MLHKRILFVSLLAPSLSFASTATDSLSGVTGDVFDIFNENPAHVNVEGGKSFVRLGKEGGLQVLTKAAGFGLGIQVNAENELPVVSGSFNSKDAPATFASVSTNNLAIAASQASKAGMPMALTLGGVAGDMKWGVRLGYQNIRTNVELPITDTTGKVLGTALSPTYSAAKVRAGVVMGDIEAALAWGKGDWKQATSRAEHDGNPATADKATKYMEDGVSAQSTQGYELATRYIQGNTQWFLQYGQQNSGLKLWDLNDAKTGGSTYDAKDAEQSRALAIGTERSYPVVENVKLLSRSWFAYQTDTTNDSKDKLVDTDMQVSGALGAEVAAASWATLRAGVQASLWGSRKMEATSYELAGQKGKSETMTTTSSHWMRGVASPTMGLGFKFGNYTVDATLAQDGTGAMGFTNDILGKIEVT
ncbi:MAG: hypothetical protein RIR26_1392, partial [Pseudomonadota bacterium]